MEKLKAKHDHKLTDILKVGIFGLFLLMPFLTFIPTALYYGFNEHAVNETSTQVDIQYKYQSNEVNDIDDLNNENIYYFGDFVISTQDFHNTTYFGLYILQVDSIENFDTSELDENNIDLYTSKDNNFIYLNINDNGNAYIMLSNGNAYDTWLFTYEEITLYNCIGYSFDYEFLKEDYQVYHANFLPQYTDYNEIESVEIQENVEQTISQQMYKSWQTMWESPFYNWTNNSILKNGLDNFTGVFGMNNTSYFTSLLTYELIIVAIYIVLDIVLTLFTWLTHLLNNKE